ncbi:MAG: SGNH/GDSL hydrolase family protein [Chitinispirillaceae bacterium]|jgi:hypothetical protein
MKNRKITAIRCMVGIFCIASVGAQAAMIANPIISLGKPTYGSSGGTAALVDGKFGTSSTWTVTNGSWVAIKVGAGPTKVFFNWNNPDYSWSDTIDKNGAYQYCPEGTIVPVNYDILTSANSTTGADGTWTKVDSARGNTVSARGHLIDFTGASWVKMNITTGGGTLDEIEVFDCSNGAEDIWFFPGTSISANTYKAYPPAQNFADLVATAHPAFHPAMIRGGIPCIYSTQMAAYISSYLDMARNAHYWAIEMGTNDVWGGSTANLASFTRSMQLIIDSCKAAGIQPMIARMIATDSALAGWEVNPAFLKAIDSLTTVNDLIAGPDLYTWFKTHPADYVVESGNSGIHPNDSGAAHIQQLWATTVNSLYTATAVVNPSLANHASGNSFHALLATSMNGRLMLRSQSPGTVAIFSLSGSLIGKPYKLSAGTHAASAALRSGCYLVKFTSNNYMETTPVVVQ